MWYPSTTSQLGEADLGVIGVLGALGFPAVTLGRTPETMQISVVGGGITISRSVFWAFDGL